MFVKGNFLLSHFPPLSFSTPHSGDTLHSLPTLRLSTQSQSHLLLSLHLTGALKEVLQTLLFFLFLKFFICNNHAAKEVLSCRVKFARTFHFTHRELRLNSQEKRKCN